MSSRLENCPNEIIEAIVVLLDLDDIRSLRLSCRSLAAKTTQDHFKSYYHLKRVEIAPRALKGLVDAIQPGRLGCLVRELVLVGITTGWKVNGSKLQYSPGENELDLLVQAFGAIAANRENGILLSLSLEVAIVQKGSAQRLLTSAVGAGVWKGVWQCAAQTYNVAMRALAASRLSLGKLVVFNSDQLGSCSLACDELGRVDLQEKGPALSLSSLKTLSVSLSDRIIENLPPSPYGISRPAKEKDIREARKKAMAQSNFIGLAQLLQITTSLESFEIHYYRLETARRLIPNSSTYHENLLKQVVKSEELPKLNQCRLCGIYVRDEDLLAFIQRTAPRRLLLENLNLSSGTFRSIFDYCADATARIEEYFFEDLFEMQNSVYFNIPGQVALTPVQQHQPTSARYGATSLRRVGTESKQLISYYIHPGELPDSPMLRNWRIQRLLKYGPPRV